MGLQRFGPLARHLAAAMAIVVLALGWHNHLTLENVVAQRDRFHDVLASIRVLAVLAYMAIYMLTVALSIPGGLILTVAGGLLFGSWIGGLAAVVGGDLGATIVFLIARTAVGESFSERAGPWLGKLSVGFKDEALSYMLFLRLVPAFPFWFVNIAPAVLGVPLRTYVIGNISGYHPGDLRVCFGRCGPGQRRHGRKEGVCGLRGARRGRRLQTEDPRQLAAHQRADPGSGAVGPGGADTRRPQEVEKDPCRSQMTAPPA